VLLEDAARSRTDMAHARSVRRASSRPRHAPLQARCRTSPRPGPPAPRPVSTFVHAV